MNSGRDNFSKFYWITSIPLALIIGLASCETKQSTSQLSVGSCTVGVDNEADRLVDLEEMERWRTATQDRYLKLPPGSEEEEYLDDLQWIIMKAKEKIEDQSSYLAIRDRESRLHAVAIYSIANEYLYVDFLFARPQFDPHRIAGSGVAALATLLEQFPAAKWIELNAVSSAVGFYERFGFRRIDLGYDMFVSRGDFLRKFEEWRSLRYP